MLVVGEQRLHLCPVIPLLHIAVMLKMLESAANLMVSPLRKLLKTYWQPIHHTSFKNVVYNRGVGKGGGLKPRQIFKKMRITR